MADEPEAERPAWYGGNKIPESYLRKMGLRGGKQRTDNDDELPEGLASFLDDI